jgi:hypothetical protein
MNKDYNPMDSEDKFWISVWAILAVVIISITLATMLYWKDHNAKLTEMVNNGTNPIAAMCALQDHFGRNPVCIILATKK